MRGAAQQLVGDAVAAQHGPQAAVHVHAARSFVAGASFARVVQP